MSHFHFLPSNNVVQKISRASCWNLFHPMWTHLKVLLPPAQHPFTLNTHLLLFRANIIVRMGHYFTFQQQFQRTNSIFMFGGIVTLDLCVFQSSNLRFLCSTTVCDHVRWMPATALTSHHHYFVHTPWLSLIYHLIGVCPGVQQSLLVMSQKVPTQVPIEEVNVVTRSGLQTH